MQLIKSPEPHPFTFESTLLLYVLANYHRSDAANLNPYLRRIRNPTHADEEVWAKVCWVARFAFETATK